jgi:hypothetical protein
MDEPHGAAPSPDDTAAFQRFYAEAPAGQSPPAHGVLYRVFIGWWRDRH